MNVFMCLIRAVIEDLDVVAVAVLLITPATHEQASSIRKKYYGRIVWSRRRN